MVLGGGGETGMASGAAVASHPHDQLEGEFAALQGIEPNDATAGVDFS